MNLKLLCFLQLAQISICNGQISHSLQGFWIIISQELLTIFKLMNLKYRSFFASSHWPRFLYVFARLVRVAVVRRASVMSLQAWPKAASMGYPYIIGAQNFEPFFQARTFSKITHRTASHQVLTFAF